MTRTLPGGFLLVLDGSDGVGKTTQLQLVKESLEAAGWQPIVRRNLGGTPIGEELRQVMIKDIPRPTETNLYISTAIQAALIEQVDKDRAEGRLILMDRGPLSLAAYAIFGDDLDENLGWPHVDEGMNRLKADLMIIYKADIAESLERAKSVSTTQDHFENKPLSYFEKVSHGYDESQKRYENIIEIDANQSIEEVHKLTMEAVNKALGVV
jgi:dTMP kinase